MGRFILAMWVVCIAGQSGRCDPPPAPSTALSISEIDQLIRDLGDKRFNVREQASKKLWAAGAAAEAAVRRAAKDPDAEIARRSKALLDKFELGIYPDTPAAVVALLEQFRDGDDDGRRQAANGLIEQGVDGFAALGRLKLRAKSDDERRMLAAMMTQASVKARPALLKARDYAGLERLLESCLDHEADEAIANYTALMLLRDKLPATLARWEAEHSAAPTPRTAEVLASLYRAKGDWGQARKHAAGRPELLDSILWEQGDWAELAKRPAQKLPGNDLVPSPAIDRAVRAAYYRLAGNVKESAALIDELQAVKSPAESRLIALGLLLNERPADALKRLEGSPDITFDLLLAQLRYREAFQTAERKPPASDEERQPFVEELDGGRRRFALKQARTWHQIGERDRALQQFAKLFAECTAATDGPIVAELVEMQSRLGLRDLACESAAKYLGTLSGQAVETHSDPTEAVLEAAFPKRGGEAKTWWIFLRQKFAKDDELAAMRRLRGLLDPGATPIANLDELAADLIASLPDDDAAALVRGHRAAAAAFEAARRSDAAVLHSAEAAERGNETAQWIRLGDLQAGRQKFAEAAAAYSKAALRSATDPIPKYLEGWALQKSGRVAEAEALFEQARLMPLGNLHQRAIVVQELSRRDMLDLARAERALVLKLGWRNAWADGGFLSLMARDAVLQKDFARAADCYERIIIAVVENNLSFVENGAYMNVPALAHAYRARAALAEGRLDAVRSEAEKCLVLTPGNLDLAILLVPELTKRGRTVDADALYKQAADAYSALSRDHPNSSFAHNSAAWLAACCRRDLDAALVHARRATELTPKHAGYRDTLAEVYFQRGDKVKAIELMRECRAMEPRNEYFVKQLKRFESGDPSVPPPPEVDDN